MPDKIKKTVVGVMASVVKLGMTFSFLLNVLFLFLLVNTTGATQKILAENMVAIFVANNTPFGGSVLYEKFIKK